jgi:hypothetical protein
MLSEYFNFLVIPISLGVSGLIFLAIAFFLKLKYGYKGGIKSEGTLIGFRKLDNDHYFGALAYAIGQGKYKDFNYNVQNSKPIIRFSAGQHTVEAHTEWSVSDLDKKDIGRQLPIRYFLSRDGNVSSVILEGKQYESHRVRGRRIIFWVFAGMGIALIVIASLVMITFG